MPQIAQQDYLYIRPENANTVKRDAAALAKVKKAIQAGTIWDCILQSPISSEGEGRENSNISRVLGTVYDNTIIVFDGVDTEIAEIPARYSVRQYEGLAAIQKEEVSQGFIADQLDIPKLVRGGEEANLLSDGNIGAYISVDSHYLEVTVVTGNIVDLKIGEHISDGDDFVNITWEDAQKLILLPIE